MTRQTWTAVVSALVFGACVVVGAVVPVPFVVWGPGPTVDLLATGSGAPVRVVSGATEYPTSGRLLLTTVSQTEPDRVVSLVEALYSYWANDREVLPRSAIYPAGASVDVVSAEDAATMAASEANAKAAALRTAGVKVDPVPIVDSVNAAGPAAGRLAIHDTVVAIRYASAETATNVQTAADAVAAIASGRVGEQVVFSILRDGARRDVVITTQGSKSNPDLPVAGVSFVQGYSYAPTIQFALDGELGADVAGLMLALAIYDKVTPGALLKERVVAGNGALDANGAVGRVRGIREKIIAAERAGASVFLLPAANCSDLIDVHPTVRLVPVTTLAGAIDALGALGDPAREKSVKGCS